MNRTSGLAHRIRAAGIAAIVSLGATAVVGAPVSAAQPTPPEPTESAAPAESPAPTESPAPAAPTAPTSPTAAVVSQPVPLMPGTSGLYQVVVTDEGIYLLLLDEHTVYRRTLTRDASGITLGAATFVGHSASDGGIAVHDGVLAFARPVDDRLVLAAPDGTETLPTWDDGTTFVRGMNNYTGTWISADTIGMAYRLLNVATGAEVNLWAITPAVPAEIDNSGIASFQHTDDQVVWTVTGHNLYDELRYSAVYSSALDANGPTGPVTTLDEELCSTPSCGWKWPVMVEDDAVVWIAAGSVDGALYRWFAGEPYTGTPHELLVPSGQVARFSGSEVAIWEGSDSGSFVRWYDLASTMETPTRTAFIPGWVQTVAGTLVVYTTDGENYELLDATGLPITADPTPAVTPAFTDVLGAVDYAWSHPPGFPAEIQWLADHGIVGGFADGTYRGLTAVSRGAMAAFLYRTTHDGADAPACTTAPFTDVATTHPFCGEIAWLAEAGITTGWPDGTFRPTQPVSREAMAAFLYRLANDDADAPACTTAPFTDVATTNPFCGEITWLTDTGITTGWPDGTFHPTTAVSRQAMAAFLFRYIDAGLVPTT